MLYVIHHWLLPVVGSVVWFGMLWAMLIWWLCQGRPVYAWQNGPIAFISDIGATKLQPLFIAGSSVMALCFVLTVASDRLLRHQSRLVRNMRRTERILSYCAIAGSAIGGIGIILVSCFNTHFFPHAHDGFLLMFIVGVALSAIFTTIEFRYLDVHNASTESHRHLKISYMSKIVIVSIEIILAIAFAATLFGRTPTKHNVSAILEWLVAFLFTFYLLSFAWDLYPAAKAQQGEYAESVLEHGGMVGSTPMRHSDSPAGTVDSQRPMVEAGHHGTATMFGTGPQAQQMGAAPGGRVAVQHLDEYGRSQRPL